MHFIAPALDTNGPIKRRDELDPQRGASRRQHVAEEVFGQQPEVPQDGHLIEETGRLAPGVLEGVDIEEVCAFIVRPKALQVRGHFPMVAIQEVQQEDRLFQVRRLC